MMKRVTFSCIVFHEMHREIVLVVLHEPRHCEILFVVAAYSRHGAVGAGYVHRLLNRLQTK